MAVRVQPDESTSKPRGERARSTATPRSPDTDGLWSEAVWSLGLIASVLILIMLVSLAFGG